MKPRNLIEIKQKISYEFKNRELLEEALRHSSFVNELSNSYLRDNECFEFLGDAVLNLVIGHILMIRFPKLKEGQLSRMRAALVNETQLADLAGKTGLGAYLSLGKGEIQTQGRKKKSILADAVEAVIAAVYLDGGFETAFRFIEYHFDPIISSMDEPDGNHDYKSQLQELVQIKHKMVPEYKVIGECGPDHDKIFSVQLNIQDIQTEGEGKSKKIAEQDAARKAVELLIKE
ncbi:MAG: ribonuclease III [Desulfobacterales bacterium]|nr:ribonuclease III [Desulfobacterales bacterium]MDD4072382.1 ribonuclease III [Desulfobacterales bacterium]MDD4392343.1 ribonuclease III [Desulfobacterales bacterium]